MSISDLTSRVASADESNALDAVILEAADFVECGDGSTSELSDLFRSIVEQIDLIGDREEALNCLSNCSIAVGSLQEIDLAKLAALAENFGEGETLAFINILANSDQAKFLDVLERLTAHENEEVSIEAEHAMEELQRRLK